MNKAQWLAEDLELNHEYCPKEVILQAAAELRRLHKQELANIEWQKKTDWVQKTIQFHELGLHRADILRARIANLHNEVERLNAALQREQDRSEHIGTHGPGCHLWGHRHHACLEREYKEAIKALIELHRINLNNYEHDPDDYENTVQCKMARAAIVKAEGLK